MIGVIKENAGRPLLPIGVTIFESYLSDVHELKKLSYMKASEFDTKFDEGQESVLKDLDLTQARRPGHKQKRVNIDFPIWMVNALDREAKRLGVTRQSVIKIWLAERLESIVRNQ